MDKQQLTDLVEQHLSTRRIASVLSISQTNIRYWLRKYALTTDPVYYRKNHRCWKCGETDSEKFYGNKKNACAKCHNMDVGVRGALLHKRAVEHLGGKCTECGYNKYICSLDVHHVDPSIKDSNFSSWRNWSWKRAVIELKKCILLCSNCHHALHGGHKLAVAKPGIAPGLGPGDRKFKSCQPDFNAR